MHLDQAKPDILYDDITVDDDALTRPWSVRRTYRRERHPVWLETICGEVEPQVKIGAEDYSSPMTVPDAHPQGPAAARSTEFQVSRRRA